MFNMQLSCRCFQLFRLFIPGVNSKQRPLSVYTWHYNVLPHASRVTTGFLISPPALHLLVAAFTLTCFSYTNRNNFVYNIFLIFKETHKLKISCGQSFINILSMQQLTKLHIFLSLRVTKN